MYGENHDQEEADSVAAKSSAGEATKKRKAVAEAAAGSYNWAELADEGKVSLFKLFLFHLDDHYKNLLCTRNLKESW